MSLELKKFPLSTRLATVSTTVARAVSGVKLTPSVHVDADDVAKAIDTSIEETWKNSGLRNLSPADYTRVQLMSQDAVLEQIYGQAKLKLGNSQEKKQHLADSIEKASKANAICNDLINLAEREEYSSAGTELTPELKKQIQAIYENEISDKDVLHAMKMNQPETYTKVVSELGVPA